MLLEALVGIVRLCVAETINGLKVVTGCPYKTRFKSPTVLLVLVLICRTHVRIGKLCVTESVTGLRTRAASS